MKILELQFRNLNSLYGQWKIDFTHPEFVTDGIFALTGPTGAGKSTILDAICLALYGATPRLGKISSDNDIMSRQTGECYAEVLFESQAGQFRCQWQQRCAYKKPGETLQDPKHQISDANGVILESKRSLVPKVVESKTGMDFERFTRSILLAQGSFDSFLKADDEQKSTILERITGTEIYSRISKQVHQIRKDHSNLLDQKKLIFKEIELLTEQEVDEIRSNKVENEKCLREVVSQFEQNRKGIRWLQSIQEMKDSIQELQQKSDAVEEQWKAFEPDKLRLQKAQKATVMDEVFGILTTLRHQQQNESKSLAELQNSLPTLQTECEEKESEYQRCVHATNKRKEELEAEAEVWKQVRSYDQDLDNRRMLLEETKLTLGRKEAEVEAKKAKRRTDVEEKLKAEKAIEESENYLKNNLQDKMLVASFTGIQQQFSNLASKNSQLKQLEKQLKKILSQQENASQSFQLANNGLKEQVAELAEMDAALADSEKDLKRCLEGKLLREYVAEKDQMQREKSLVQTIHNLEEHRKKLEDDQPCPLCGALEHPYAVGNVPKLDAIDLRINQLVKKIAEAEKLVAAVESWKEKRSGVLLKQAEWKSKVAISQNDLESLQGECRICEGSISDCRVQIAELKSEVLETLAPLGFSEFEDGNEEKLLKSLKGRLNQWERFTKHKIEFEKIISTIDLKVKGHDAAIETLRNTVEESRGEFQKLEKVQIEIESKRNDLYGKKVPDVEEKRLKGAMNSAENLQEAGRKLLKESTDRKSVAETKIGSLKQSVEDRKSDLEKRVSEFGEQLIASEFTDEASFLAARMSAEEREKLENRRKELEKERSNLKATKEERHKRLADELKKEVTDKSLDELQPLVDELEKKRTELQEEVSKAKHRLEENKRAEEKLKEKKGEIQAQEREYERWNKLHSLIGSADGKRYRTFAQGLTFELMISHANQQLKKMSKRYLLLRDKENPLELNVLDGDQAGEVRTTKNLSGGESFLVSLALALGLSKMASKNVQVDSLFLDEGFGTLDEEALEVALDTLSNLYQEGKIIGIISHVAALKERIATQVKIDPISGGRSRISGPGCSEI